MLFVEFLVRVEEPKFAIYSLVVAKVTTQIDYGNIEHATMFKKYLSQRLNGISTNMRIDNLSDKLVTSVLLEGVQFS